MKKSFKYKVATLCFTYNHSLYIKNTLDGFVSQQTRFPVVYVVVDDASTDGEGGILHDWANANLSFEDNSISYRKEMHYGSLFYAKHKNNPNAFFTIVLLSENHYQKGKDDIKLSYISEWLDKSEYNAICEGDDYWIDQMKLQKQTDFMDAHPEHSLCFCAHYNLMPSGDLVSEKRYETNIEICPMKDIILGGGGYMATNTMFYRRSSYVNCSIWAIDCPIGDAPIMLTLANNGLVGYLSDVMGVYRISAAGSWTVRMASSKAMRRNHHRAIINMWHQFDEWSDMKYHKLVSRKVWIVRKGFLRNELAFFAHKILNI